MAAIAKRFKPLLDRVLVERFAPKTKTLGGLILPESAQTKLNEGVVLSTGAGARNKDGALIPLGVKVGDRVLLPEYGGSKVKLDESDKEYVLYRDEDILGVLTDATAAAKK